MSAEICWDSEVLKLRTTPLECWDRHQCTDTCRSPHKPKGQISMSDKQTTRIEEINRQLEMLREARGKEAWGSIRYDQIRRQIADLLSERDRVSKSA